MKHIPLVTANALTMTAWLSGYLFAVVYNSFLGKKS